MRKIWLTLLTVCWILLLTLTPSWVGIAQNPLAPNSLPEQATPANKIDGFPVVLDGETLFFIRRGVGSFSAEERANAITERIKTIAQDDSIPLEKLKIETNPDDQLPILSFDREVILTVSAQDAKAYRTKPEELAQDALQRIRAAIEQYRHARQPTKLLRGVIYTVLASIALLAIGFSIIKLSAKFFPFTRRLIELQVPSLRIQNFELISSRQISLLFLRFLQFIRLFVFLCLFYGYITFVLQLFPWTRALGESTLNYLFLAFNYIFAAISAYLPNLFLIAVIIFITYYIIRLIKPFFTAIERGHLVIPGFYPDWAIPTYKLLLFLIIALAAVVAFPYLPGFNSPAFQGISVFLGLLLSLGSTTAIANVVGGIILVYTRAFQVGDRIQIGEVVGDVIEKTLLVARIRTPTNKVITIPNSSLLSSNVINFSASARELKKPLILQTTITLGYDLPWRKVHATLVEAALATQGILAEPQPFVLQTSLDDFYISYQLCAYTDKPNLMMFIYSELHQTIQDKCNEVGIEIMSPHYASLREGNQSTIPENYLPTNYVPPPFRVQSLDNNEKSS